MSTFGSPQLKDPTAGWEKMIEEVADWTVFAVNEVAPLVMNRPPGTKMKSKEEDHTDWMNAMLDPSLLKGMFDQLAGTYGPENAALELLRWDAEHKAMHEKAGHAIPLPLRQMSMPESPPPPAPVLPLEKGRAETIQELRKKYEGIPGAE